MSGRWTAKDPLGFRGGDFNLYRFANGDPINGRDPSGLYPDDPAYIPGQNENNNPDYSNAVNVGAAAGATALGAGAGAAAAALACPLAAAASASLEASAAICTSAPELCTAAGVSGINGFVQGFTNSSSGNPPPTDPAQLAGRELGYVLGASLNSSFKAPQNGK